MNTRKSKLTLKFIIGFVILGVAIISVACATGFVEFQNDIKKQYNDEAYAIAHVAESYIDEETAKEYGQIAKDYSNGKFDQEQIDEIIASEKYQNLCDLFSDLRVAMGANDIYLVYCNTEILNNYQGTKEGWTPFTYILDCYSVPEYSYVLGNQSPINPDFIDATTSIVKTGERVDNYFESKSDYGYNTTALIAISMGDENLALGVEIPMVAIESSIKQYIIRTICYTSGVVILGILLFAVLVFKNVVKPVNKVATAASNFINNNKQISSELEEIKTKDEIENLSQSVLKMEIDLNTYIDNLTRVTAEKERIGAELNVATQIQSSMLPSIFPAFPAHKEFDVFATMTPAKEVGGDFYDFFMLDDTHVAMVMADVSGKGVPAALFMVIAKTLIKDHTTASNQNLGEVFNTVNNLLCESNSSGLFVTAFEGVLDLVTGEFNYVNAGHEMPFIYKKNEGYTAFKTKPGFVLAGMDEMKYKAGSIVLEPGDKIFQYTDGVTEATDANNELYGMDRLDKVLNANTDKNCYDLLPIVKKDIDEFVGEAPQFDDITMLCLEFKEKITK